MTKRLHDADSVGDFSGFSSTRIHNTKLDLPSASRMYIRDRLWPPSYCTLYIPADIVKANESEIRRRIANQKKTTNTGLTTMPECQYRTDVVD
jgi:hypothetical protein